MRRTRKKEKWSLKRNAEYCDWYVPEWPASIEAPADARQLWRFMDLPKFSWLVFERRLYMPTIFALRKLDPFEGTMSPEVIDKALASMRDRMAKAGPADSQMWDDIRDYRGDVAFLERFAEMAYVSCWYAAEHPSDAMWRLYGGTNNSVAVRTNHAKLKSVLPAHVRTGLVRYSDAAPNGLLPWLFQKRNDFVHEHEVRAMALPSLGRLSEMRKCATEHGYAPLVDIDGLIESVAINPLADDWFKTVVEKILAAAGCRCEVLRSGRPAITTFPDDEFNEALRAHYAADPEQQEIRRTLRASRTQRQST
jgi:hypothetical protein